VRWFCFAAMFLSSIGDLFLARFKGLDKLFPNYFIIGASFFIAAHLMYLLCYGTKLYASGSFFWNSGAIFAIVVGITITILLCRLGTKTGNTKLLPLIILYAVIIFANCATVFSYAWSQGLHSLSSIFAAIGMVSFLLSDLVIGLGIAGDVHKFDSLIWWLYPIGQLFLILAV